MKRQVSLASLQEGDEISLASRPELLTVVKPDLSNPIVRGVLSEVNGSKEIFYEGRIREMPFSDESLSLGIVYKLYREPVSCMDGDYQIPSYDSR